MSEEDYKPHRSQRHPLSLRPPFFQRSRNANNLSAQLNGLSMFNPPQAPAPSTSRGYAQTNRESGEKGRRSRRVMKPRVKKRPQESTREQANARQETSSEESQSDSEANDSDSSTKSELEEDDEDLLPRVNTPYLDRSKSTARGGRKKDGEASISVVTNPRQLDVLGTCHQRFPPQDAQIITKYVKNSGGVDFDVKLMGIYSLVQNPTVSPRLNPNAGQLDLLLWFKTSPGSVTYLSKKSDSCVAFYDCIARAFAFTPDELGNVTLSQMLVLCAVSLGKPHKSDQGYHHWKDKRPPSGCDSIYAVGRVRSDWEDSREVNNSVLVPCGKTRAKRRGRGRSQLKYSEYIVFEASRITPLYAVDVKVTSNVVVVSSDSD